jgi:hypothetical protein
MQSGMAGMAKASNKGLISVVYSRRFVRGEGDAHFSRKDYLLTYSMEQSPS